MVLGYGLGALATPLFPLAPTIGWVFTGRFLDRIGKGIRGAPRDALIADLTTPTIRGAAYGLRQSLDTVGAFAGPLLAIALMLVFAGDFRAVFWFALIPAALSGCCWCSVCRSREAVLRNEVNAALATGARAEAALYGFATDYYLARKVEVEP